MHVDAGESKRRAGDAASSTDRSIKRGSALI